jgi:hypothetical protein
MKNLILSGLLLFGGIIISLRTYKTRGIILMFTLLLIVSATVYSNLYHIDFHKSSQNIEEYGDAAPDYKKVTLTKEVAKALTNDDASELKIKIKGLKSDNTDKMKVLTDKGTLDQTEKDELARLKAQTPIIDANLLVISDRVTEFEGSDALSKCKYVLDAPPKPVFSKIAGRFTEGKYIDQIRFTDQNDTTSESGVSTQGKEFTFVCPNGSQIVGYDINSDPKDGQTKIDSVSIFGGIGPVYCSDGSRIPKKYGKDTNQTIGQKAKTPLSTYDYTLPVGYDEKLGTQVIGSIRDVNVDTCAKVCTAMGLSCYSTSFIGANNDKGNCFFSQAKVEDTIINDASKPKVTSTGARIYNKI